MAYYHCQILWRSAKINHVASFELLSLAHMTAYIIMLVLGGGEGAVPLERPSFSVLNFCSRAYLHLWPKKSPGTSAFYSFCRSGDHHFQNFCTCKPFHRHPQPIYWGSWTQNVSSALRVYSWPECQPYASYKSAPETPHFMFEPAPELHICTLEHAVEPCNFMLDLFQSPYFSLCCGTDLPQFGPRSIPLHPDASLQILD